MLVSHDQWRNYISLEGTYLVKKNGPIKSIIDTRLCMMMQTIVNGINFKDVLQSYLWVLLLMEEIRFSGANKILVFTVVMIDMNGALNCYIPQTKEFTR